MKTILFKLVVLMLFISISFAAKITCPKDLCNNNKPPRGKDVPKMSCKKAKQQGKCDADYMRGYCECTCEKCPFMEEIKNNKKSRKQDRDDDMPDIDIDIDNIDLDFEFSPELEMLDD